MNLEPYLAAAREIAHGAGRLILSKASTPHPMEFKEAFNPVTIIDRQSESFIIEALTKRFPDHGIVAEEGTAVHPDNDFLWVIDPLDGTTNFAHNLPQFSVSIALLIEKKPAVGVVYAPCFDEEFYAMRGGGAFLNSKSIHVSAVRKMEHAFLVTGEPYTIRKNIDYHIGLFKAMMKRTLAIRRFGSACLDFAAVACGRFDGYWEAGLKPWDAAAGVLLVEEAGGNVNDYHGKPFDVLYPDTLLASNGQLHSALLEVLKS